MRNFYLLVSDGKRGIFLDSDGHVSLPCQGHWPIMRKIPKAWATALFQHVTYNLFSLEFKKNQRPFGLPKKASFKTSLVDPDTLNTIAKNNLCIRRWHQYHASYVCPWKLKILDLDTTLADLPSTHCLRAFTHGIEKGESAT